MFLDFKILLVHCVNDYYNFGYLNNILVNFIDYYIEIIEENKFELKMSMQSYMISFIGKYRSLWDKIMNILVYIYNNNETFNKYMKKNSKNEFKKIFEKNKIFWDKFSRYRDLIKKFDDNFRTQEIHAVGELYKKLIFSDNKIMGTNYVEINNYFNNLIEFKGVFADLINAVRKIRNY
jgi:site-specific DNA-adenine methylase